MTEGGKIAVVILAAGASSRMGKPKQLLPVKGVPLLQRSVNAAVQFALSEGGGLSSLTSVFVVLGANASEIQAKIDFAHCRVLLNPNWQSGMSSSVILALTDIQNSLPEAPGVLLMMADQPWVTESVLADIVAKFKATGSPIVVSTFAAKGSDEKVPGPPAFFAKELFPELLQLEGDVGARKIVLAHPDRVTAIDFPLGAIDIDTEKDYLALLAAL
jgi:molybdenum cofactor cytidylyltransferase